MLPVPRMIVHKPSTSTIYFILIGWIPLYLFFSIRSIFHASPTCPGTSHEMMMFQTVRVPRRRCKVVFFFFVDRGRRLRSPWFFQSCARLFIIVFHLPSNATGTFRSIAINDFFVQPIATEVLRRMRVRAFVPSHGVVLIRVEVFNELFRSSAVLKLRYR